MSREDPSTDREPLPPKTITDRLTALTPGDTITFNNRDALYEVVETNRYSVTLVDSDEHRITLSQNLQAGGWAVHEEVWWIDSGRDPD